MVDYFWSNIESKSNISDQRFITSLQPRLKLVDHREWTSVLNYNIRVIITIKPYSRVLWSTCSGRLKRISPNFPFASLLCSRYLFPFSPSHQVTLTHPQSQKNLPRRMTRLIPTNSAETSSFSFPSPRREISTAFSSSSSFPSGELARFFCFDFFLFLSNDESSSDKEEVSSDEDEDASSEEDTTERTPFVSHCLDPFSFCACRGDEFDGFFFSLFFDIALQVENRELVSKI